MKRLPAFSVLLLSSVAAIFAASGTVTFNSASGISGNVATDGQGGSTDISGLTLEFSATASAGGSALPMTYEPDIYPGQNALAAGYTASTAQGTYTIKSTSTAVNFALQSLYIVDYGGSAGDTLKIEGFDNGGSTGSIIVTTAADPWYHTFDLATLGGTKFQNVDEVRISESHGRDMWIAVNQAQIGPPVAPDTTPPTIASIVRLTPAAQALAASITSVTFRVNYSEAVQNVTTAQFAIQPVNGGTVTGTVTAVSGTGVTRDVTVTLTGGAGEFRLEPVD